MSRSSFTLDHPLFANRTGRGVRVAVIDSGIHTANPHITSVHSGVNVLPDGEDDDLVDRLGHGTAVAAAILEKAPGIELVVLKVFDRSLSTSAAILARAIESAANQGCRLINLSLGTSNPQREAALSAAVTAAASMGALVVSARELEGVRWFPGSLPGVVGVVLDESCPRDELRVEVDPGGDMVCHASGDPRPIPGVTPGRNVWGISFAVANTTGFLARLIEAQPDLRTLPDVCRAFGKL